MRRRARRRRAWDPDVADYDETGDEAHADWLEEDLNDALDEIRNLMREVAAREDDWAWAGYRIEQLEPALETAKRLLKLLS